MDSKVYTTGFCIWENRKRFDHHSLGQINFSSKEVWFITYWLLKHIFNPIPSISRWFTHFYLFAMIYTLAVTSLMFMSHCFSKDVPQIFEHYIQVVSYHSHESIGTVSLYKCKYSRISSKLWNSMQVIQFHLYWLLAFSFCM